MASLPESTAQAAEIRLLSASALHPAIDALIPDFEKSSGHKITVTYGTAGAVADRVQKGEAADLIVSSVPMIDRLQAQGKVIAGDRIIMAKVGVGAFVRKGAAKPDISSADAFKRSMLAATSITYPNPSGGGASGIPADKVSFSALGIGGVHLLDRASMDVGKRRILAVQPSCIEWQLAAHCRRPSQSPRMTVYGAERKVAIDFGGFRFCPNRSPARP